MYLSFVRADNVTIDNQHGSEDSRKATNMKLQFTALKAGKEQAVNEQRDADNANVQNHDGLKQNHKVADFISELR